MPELGLYLLEHKGQRCPFCLDGDLFIDTDYTQLVIDRLFVKTECPKCGAKFETVFKLEGLTSPTSFESQKSDV